jgi:hypothetical protein
MSESKENISANFTNSTNSTNSISESKEKVSGKSKISVDEAMNEYYKLKAKYETDYHEKYIKPILKANDKSKREKRLEYQKLPKAECINCKRNVGSIFTIEKNAEDYSRTFIAKCGDLTDPCPLDINFNYTFRDELSRELLKSEKDIDEIKNKIIIDKNNMMFGYVAQAQALVNFEGDTTELKSITESAGFIMEINIQLNDNPVKNDLIKKNEDKLGMEFLLPFKDMIKTFDQTGNVEVINKAVKLYVEEIVPLTTNIRNLKYEVSYVDFLEKKDNDDPDEKGDLYILVQKKNSLQNLEYTLYGYDEVKSFTKGISGFNIKSSANKTMKNLEQVHRKTRKLRPSNIDFDIEGEEEVKEVQGPINLKKKLVLVNATEALDEEQKMGKKLSVSELHPELYKRVEGEIMPNRGPGGWYWENENGETDMTYQRTWDALSPEYQAALSQDDAWMKKTIDNFVEYDNLRRQNKVPYTSSREFVHPDGLLLPPQKIGENDYDYGNEVYNKLLNTGAPGIWLSFLPKPDGKKLDQKSENAIWKKMFPDYYSNEYNPYLEAIASNLKSRLKFTKF